MLKITSKIKHIIALFSNEWTQLISLIQNTLRYLCYDFTGYLHKMPECTSELVCTARKLTPFMDVSLQQRAETRQLNSKLTAFYYNSVIIIMLCI